MTDRSFTEARLGEAPDEVNRRYVLGPMLENEQLLLPIFLEVDQAHVVMLTEEGILTEEDGGRILAALHEMAEAETLDVDPAYDSLLLQIERELGKRIGEERAGRLHTARSRNDQSSTVDRVYIRTELLDLSARMLDLQATTLDLARRHLEQLMPGYTHMQPAQPVTFAHYLMRHALAFGRDQERLEFTYAHVNRSALGLAAMAGTSWPVNRSRTASLLGHEDLVRNGMDCGVFNQDYQAEVVAVLALLTADLSRLATDLYVWSGSEYGMVEIADGLSGTSSIMPQKKNPHALERIMSIGGVSTGWMASILGATRGASASDLGLTFAARPLIAMFDAARAAIQLMNASLGSLNVRSERMEKLAGEGWSTASNLADVLVQETGVPFRVAHQIVATLVRRSINEGLGPGDVGDAAVEEAYRSVVGSDARISRGLAQAALDPRRFIRTRLTPGGPNPADVREHIEEASGQQDQHRQWLTERRSRVDVARDALAKRVQEMKR